MNNELEKLSPATAQALKQTMADMELPKTVDDVRNSLERGDKDRIKQNYRNCITALQSDPLLCGGIRYNILTQRTDIVKKVWWKRDGEPMTDTDINYLYLYLEETYGLTSDKKIEKAIEIVANENRYHPIRDTLNALEWDGTERIRFTLHHFLGADINEYTYEALLVYLLGAVHRIFKPGCKVDTMLCLAGGQGAGKSTFFRFLAIKDEWFTDDLRKLDDENVFRKLQGHWIIEMSEMLATANAKSIEEIKSFLSRQKETYKTPYHKHPQDRQRQCVFGGTSNALDFLPLDRTGNRRFIPILVNQECSEVHILADEKQSRAYILQVWAEVMVIYKSGNYKLKFSPEVEKYMKEYQREFMPEDTWTGMIADYLEQYNGKMVCSLQLFHEALNRPYDEPKKWELGEINKIMNTGFPEWKDFSNPRHFPAPYKRQKGWERVQFDNQSAEFVEISDEEAKQIELPKEWLDKK